MRRVLITGAGSYVGGWVRRRLEREPEKYSVEELDVQNDSWQSFDFRGYDCVFHVAGIAHIRESTLSEDKYVDVNCKLALDVAKHAAACGVGQFVFMSTAAVYGDGSRLSIGRITPDTSLNPTTWYGKSKAETERRLGSLASGSFRVCILRCPMIYGPACKGNFAQLIKIASVVPFFPRVDNRHSALHVDNLAEFVALAAERGASGLFWPQDATYLNTSEAISVLGQAMGKYTVLFGALAPLAPIAGRIAGFAKKVFGDSWFDLDCRVSSIDDLYRVMSFSNTSVQCVEPSSGVSI